MMAVLGILAAAVLEVAVVLLALRWLRRRDQRQAFYRGMEKPS